MLSDADYQYICERLPLASRKQRDDFRQRIVFLSQGKDKQAEGVEEQDWLLEGIIRDCKKRGMYVSRNFHMRNRKTGSFASYITKSQIVRELLLECAPGLSPVQQQALGVVAARELADYLTVGASFEYMMKMVHLVPTALERAFPGYMASKLLGMVVRYDGN